MAAVTGTAPRQRGRRYPLEHFTSRDGTPIASEFHRFLAHSPLV